MLDIPIKFFNTKGRRLEIFKSQLPGIVRYYSCGPTVYHYPHIGNMFSFTLADLVDRMLTFWGYNVVHVINITDVGHLAQDADMGTEDRIMKALGRWKAEGRNDVTVQDIIDYYTAWFIRDLLFLGIRMPTYMPFASHHIKEMQDIISKLLEKGFAYKTSTAVYYNVPKFKDYEKLYKQALRDKIIQARSEVKVDTTKKHPADFRLWQLDQPNHIMNWESPWGKGFPGWHIECSAMSMKYLGHSFDIHSGGIDHIPVHHTNEIAQSEACTGKEYANYWLHNQHVKIHGEKMAKSAGNFTTLQTLLDKGYKPWHIKMFFTLHHYRSVLDFTDEGIEHARNLYSKLSEYFQVAKWRLLQANYSIETIHKLLGTLYPEVNSWYEVITDLKNLDKDSTSSYSNGFLEHYLRKIQNKELDYINFVGERDYIGQIPKEVNKDMLTYDDVDNLLKLLVENHDISTELHDDILHKIRGLLEVVANDLSTPLLWSKAFELLKKAFSQEPLISLVIIAIASALTGVQIYPFLLPIDLKFYSQKELTKFMDQYAISIYEKLLNKSFKLKELRSSKKYKEADLLKQELLNEKYVQSIIDLSQLSIVVLKDNVII